MDPISFRPIAVVRSSRHYRFESPRQGVFGGGDGVIELLPEYGGDAVADLAGFDRIWVIFCFHLNADRPWKPKVRPPIPEHGICRSVYATRSPYRPNPIGLSCVQLVRVERRKLHVRGIDMLDGTPVLDLKPYIPEADAFPFAAVGWRKTPDGEPWEVTAAARFRKQAEFIRTRSDLDLENFCRVQLSRSPLDPARKRLTPEPDGQWTIGCRTWRVVFRCAPENRQVRLREVRSNYPAPELVPGAADPYQDKELHRRFLAANWSDCNE
ncbi:MAG: tRNA (N6-threonylcarbamoyladenosine(37)-N6)-methyltransferase TrmO [Lentisphaeria bacterium]|nr:tRNA (N6-threonylcarbamoyladenosine(37)-N6)-methyltransferase TrmO [Lentisphaeria bacterium]